MNSLNFMLTFGMFFLRLHFSKLRNGWICLSKLWAFVHEMTYLATPVARSTGKTSLSRIDLWLIWTTLVWVSSTNTRQVTNSPT
ncbi:hypothetical protein HanPI659440_Chr04g0159531 [Helianthus annuus]|nr:hypothetical protein HanPI659440_Chr04g0159531 [Helianthus annuus]